jgi:hypothetical protein
MEMKLGGGSDVRAASGSDVRAARGSEVRAGLMEDGEVERHGIDLGGPSGSLEGRNCFFLRNNHCYKS